MDEPKSDTSLLSIYSIFGPVRFIERNRSRGNPDSGQMDPTSMPSFSQHTCGMLWAGFLPRALNFLFCCSSLKYRSWNQMYVARDLGARIFSFLGCDIQHCVGAHLAHSGRPPSTDSSRERSHFLEARKVACEAPTYVGSSSPEPPELRT